MARPDLFRGISKPPALRCAASPVRLESSCGAQKHVRDEQQLPARSSICGTKSGGPLLVSDNARHHPPSPRRFSRVNRQMGDYIASHEMRSICEHAGVVGSKIDWKARLVIILYILL